MGKKTVYISIAHSKPHIEKIREEGAVELVLPPDVAPASYTVPKETARQVNFLFCELPPQNMEDFEQLEVVQIASTGYSQLFGLGLAEKGVRACNGRGEFDTPIAEWAVAMMVALNRDLRAMLRNQNAGVWDRDPRFQTDIRGKTVGFFGYGSLARETARLCHTMGMQIHAFDRERADFTERNYYSVPGTGDAKAELPQRFYGPGQEQDFFAGLDFLVVAMPLTKATEGILSEEKLRMLPKGAYLLNYARGPLIDEQALLNVLRDDHLGGAAIDAHFRYPMPADHPLWRFPNVIITPHISGSSGGPTFIPRIYDIFTQNLSRYLAGEPLLNELTPYQLDGN